MRIVVMGAGAIGSWLGALLSKHGHDVTLVAREEHAAIVNAMGLRVSGKTELEARPKAVREASEAAVPDLLLLTVKSYDTEKAIQQARPLIGEQTLVMSVQNGLGNVERISRHIDPRRVLAAVTSHGVTFVEPGHVRHAGAGYFLVGSPSGQHETATRIAKLFAETGLEVHPTDNVVGELWAKVIVNASINPITAITGLTNGHLVTNASLRELMQRAGEEALDVARAEGVDLPPDDMLVRARIVAEMTEFNKSSMLQDIERGRQTEVDSISGEIIQRGLVHAIDTPVTLTLRALVKGIEETTRR